MRELFLSPHVVLGRDNRGAIGEPLGKEPIPFVPSLTLPLPFFFGVPLGDRVRGGAHDRASAFRCRSRSQSSSVAIFQTQPPTAATRLSPRLRQSHMLKSSDGAAVARTIISPRGRG